MACLSLCASGWGITVTTSADSGTGSLRAALTSAVDGDTIDIDIPGNMTITLTSGMLPIITQNNLTIANTSGMPQAISGNSANRIFFILGSGVSISNLTLENALGKGGTGGAGGQGGGGGGGLGSALFAAEGSSVQITNVNFQNNTAQGGAGGAPNGNLGGGGGGGLMGTGGVGGSSGGVGGGGGGGGFLGTGGTGDLGGGGGGGFGLMAIGGSGGTGGGGGAGQFGTGGAADTSNGGAGGGGTTGMGGANAGSAGGIGGAANGGGGGGAGGNGADSNMTNNTPGSAGGAGNGTGHTGGVGSNGRSSSLAHAGEGGFGGFGGNGDTGGGGGGGGIGGNGGNGVAAGDGGSAGDGGGGGTGGIYGGGGGGGQVGKNGTNTTGGVSSGAGTGGPGGRFGGGGGGGGENTTITAGGIGGLGGSYGGGGGGGGGSNVNQTNTALAGSAGGGGVGGGNGAGGRTTTGMCFGASTVGGIGGGGGGTCGTGNSGGFAGGHGGGRGGGGGGGGGLGGAIFVEQGGSLTIQTPIAFSGNAVMGGTGTSGGGGGGALSNDFFLMSGGNATFNIPSGSLTISSSIDGDNSNTQIGIGGITLVGPGTLIFTNSNSYTSNTTISNDGTIQLSGMGSLFSRGAVDVGVGSTFDISPATVTENIGDLSGGGNVLLGNNDLMLNTQNTPTFSGTISGMGGVFFEGFGTQIFSGPNTYEGGTTLDSGQLDLAGDGSLLSTGPVTINSGAIFDISLSNGPQTIGDLSGSGGIINLGSKTLIARTGDSTTFDGVIQDGGLGGSFTKQGTGTLSLTEVNTYSGQTSIEAGTLALVMAGLLNPSGTVFVQDGATFDITMTNAGAQIGALTGPAGATVDFTGETLAIGSSISATFSGDMFGGDLMKLGTGTETLAGSVTADSIEVLQGRLNIDGMATAGTITVDASGILGGTGSIIGPIAVNGTVAPGNSIGKLTVTDITFNSGGVLQNELNASGQTDLLASTSSVTLNPGSILQIVPAPGFYISGTRYTIVTSPMVNNQFTTVLNTAPNLHFSVIYDPGTEIILLLGAVGPGPIPGLKGNAAKAAFCLQGVPTTTDSSFVFSVLNSLSIAELQAALNQIQPSLFNALSIAEEDTALSVRYTISNRLEDLERRVCAAYPVYSCQNMNLWLTPFGSFINQNNTQGQLGFDTATGGATLGFDGRWERQFSAGIAASYTYTHLDWNASGGDGHIQSYYGTLYGKWFDDQYFIDAAVLGAYSNYHAKREINITGHPFSIHRSLSSQHNGYELDGHVKLGMRRCLGSSRQVYLRPFIGFDYLFLKRGSFNETGGGTLDQKLNSQHYQLVRSEIGLDFTAIYTSKNWKWMPEIGLSYVNETRYSGQSLSAQFAGSSCTFNVRGLKPNRNMIVPSVEISAFSECWSLNLTYEGEFGEKYWNQNVLAHAGYRF